MNVPYSDEGLVYDLGYKTDYCEMVSVFYLFVRFALQWYGKPHKYKCFKVEFYNYRLLAKKGGFP